MATEIQIQNVLNVEMRQINTLRTPGGDDFVTRQIVVTDVDGQETKITLYADAKTNVAVEV